MLFLLCLVLGGDGKIEAAPYGTFAFKVEVEVPCDPEKAFDGFTGDISPWWDHSFSEKPYRFFIEPKVGGGFFELFDESGNGILHARVTGADRGKLLRLDGPLGLAGYAFHMVSTLRFKAVTEGKTLVSCEVHAAGEVPQGIPAVVQKVWTHFLVERYKPYMEGTLGKTDESAEK